MSKTDLAKFILKRIIKKDLLPCPFRKGSTNPKNGQAEPPQSCIKKGCDGVMTEDIMRTCNIRIEALVLEAEYENQR